MPRNNIQDNNQDECEENLNNAIQFSKKLLNEAKSRKDWIIKERIKYKISAVGTEELDMKIKHNVSMLKMLSLERMLYRMIKATPKNDVDKVIKNMKEKFFEASLEAMDTFKELVNMNVSNEANYIDMCDAVKTRNDEFMMMYNVLKTGDYEDDEVFYDSD